RSPSCSTEARLILLLPPLKQPAALPFLGELFRIEHLELDTAILRHAFDRPVARDGNPFAVALRRILVPSDLREMRHEVAQHGFGAALREIEIARVRAACVGVAADLDPKPRPLNQDSADVAQDWLGLGRNAPLGRREMDLAGRDAPLVEKLDLALAQLD